MSAQTAFICVCAEKLPGGPVSPSDMKPTASTKRRNEAGRAGRIKNAFQQQLHGSCSGLWDSEPNSGTILLYTTGGFKRHLSSLNNQLPPQDPKFFFFLHAYVSNCINMVMIYMKHYSLSCRFKGAFNHFTVPKSENKWFKWQLLMQCRTYWVAECCKQLM